MENLINDIKQNLIQTRDFIKNNPASPYPLNSINLIEMIDYALKNWEDPEKRLDALANLADKELELKEKGLLKDVDNDGEPDGYFVAIYDELERLDDEEKGIDTDELNGSLGDLGRSRRSRRNHRRNGRNRHGNRRGGSRGGNRRHGGRGLHNINKYNPAIVAARNALRGLIALNFMGLATILSRPEAKTKGVFQKVEKLYYGLGGKKQKLIDSINQGKKKKPLFNHKLKKQIESGKISGIDGLGSVTVASLLASAGGFIVKIWDWIKKAGLDKIVDKLPENNTHSGGDTTSKGKSGGSGNNLPDNNANNTNSNLPNNSLPATTSQSIQFPNPNMPPPPNKKNNTVKIVGFSLLTIGIIGGGYYLYKNSKNKQKQNNSKDKISKEKLSGIEFS